MALGFRRGRHILKDSNLPADFRGCEQRDVMAIDLRAANEVFTVEDLNLDLGFVKVFQLTERFKLQFRMEMFNALNHPNFDNPRDASTGSPAINSSGFGSACCTTVAPPQTQTIVQTGEAARVIQFAMKFMF